MDLKEQVAAVRRELEAKQSAAKSAWADFKAMRDGMVKEGVDLGTDKDAFEKLDEAGKKRDGLVDEVKELEGRWKRLAELAHDDQGDAGSRPDFLPGGGNGKTADGGTIPLRSAGLRLTSSDLYKQLKTQGAFENPDIPLGTTPGIKLLDRAELKTLITGESATSGGAFVEADRQSGLIELARAPIVVADLVNVTTTDSDLVEWVSQTSRTNAAAETAEAIATGDGSGAAPESAVAYAINNTDVRDLTHFLPATKRALADAGQLGGLIDSELRDGVRERLDSQMVNGNGTAPNLRGILNTAGILTQALGADTRSDAIHKGMTQVRLGFYEPTALLIHPSDWEQVVLEKDSNGNYIYGPPSQPQRSSIWGLTPVVSPVIAAGTALLGDFRRGSTLWLREGLSVAMSDSHSDFFTRRMVAVLAVLRAAFAAVRPTTFCTVTGI